MHFKPHRIDLILFSYTNVVQKLYCGRENSFNCNQEKVLKLIQCYFILRHCQRRLRILFLITVFPDCLTRMCFIIFYYRTSHLSIFIQVVVELIVNVSFGKRMMNVSIHVMHWQLSRKNAEKL